jgi:hypothetical protein
MNKVDKQAEKFFSNYSSMMNKMGDFLISIGKIEKDNTEFTNFINEAKHNPRVLTEKINMFPEPYNTKILGLFLKMTMVSNSINYMDSLTAKQKIDVGNNLKEISKEFNAIVNSLSKLETKKKAKK